MTPRFLVDSLAPGARVPLDGDAAHHAIRVLRLQPGDALQLFDGRGLRADATIAEADAKGRRCVALVGAVHAGGESESPLRVTLVQAVTAAEKMDWIVEKAVELGATGIVPVLARRSVVRLDAERSAKRLEHWRRIVVAACMQCGRDRLPELQPAEPLERWLARPRPEGARALVLDPRAQRPLSALVREALATRPARHADEAHAAAADRCLGAAAEAGARADAGAGPGACEWLVLVGPESGLDDTEIDAAVRAGFEPVLLGARVLRAETAGPAVLASLQALAGDF